MRKTGLRLVPCGPGPGKGCPRSRTTAAPGRYIDHVLVYGGRGGTRASSESDSPGLKAYVQLCTSVLFYGEGDTLSLPPDARTMLPLTTSGALLPGHLQSIRFLFNFLLIRPHSRLAGRDCCLPIVIFFVVISFLYLDTCISRRLCATLVCPPLMCSIVARHELSSQSSSLQLILHSLLFLLTHG